MFYGTAIQRKHKCLLAMSHRQAASPPRWTNRRARLSNNWQRCVIKVWARWQFRLETRERVWRAHMPVLQGGRLTLTPQRWASRCARSSNPLKVFVQSEPGCRGLCMTVWVIASWPPRTCLHTAPCFFVSPLASGAHRGRAGNGETYPGIQADCSEAREIHWTKCRRATSLFAEYRVLLLWINSSETLQRLFCALIYYTLHAYIILCFRYGCEPRSLLCFKCIDICSLPNHLCVPYVVRGRSMSTCASSSCARPSITTSRCV